MKIKIICIGKLKEKYLKDAITEYSKRIKRFSDLEILELNDEKIPEKPSEKDKEIVLKSEGSRIISSIRKDDFVISLCIEGKQMSSEEFAFEIEKIQCNGFSNITFIIGGSLGIDNSVKNMSNLRLSFSEMTFPHQLMRVILVEQIYRAFKINNNEIYHK